VIAFAKKHRILLCHDNPYSLILHDGKLRSILAYNGANEVALELNSLSKSHNMAGWRVGWITGAKDYIDTVMKVKSNVDSGMFLPVQHAAVEAMKNPTEWHAAQNEEYKKRRVMGWELLDTLRCTYSKDQAGMFLWAKVPDSVKDVEEYVENILQKALVFITPGFIFGKNGERYVRVSLCSDVKTLEQAVERIKKINT
jgi:aspartate/methionine/tyrosine aminotransferase